MSSASLQALAWAVSDLNDAISTSPTWKDEARLVASGATAVLADLQSMGASMAMCDVDDAADKVVAALVQCRELLTKRRREGRALITSLLGGADTPRKLREIQEKVAAVRRSLPTASAGGGASTSAGGGTASGASAGGASASGGGAQRPVGGAATEASGPAPRGGLSLSWGSSQKVHAVALIPHTTQDGGEDDSVLAGRVLWVSMGQRLEFYSQGSKTDFKFETKEEAVTAVAHDVHGLVWTGHLGGSVAVHQPGRWAFARFQGGGGSPVRALAVDARGQAWAGQESGQLRVLKYDQMRRTVFEVMAMLPEVPPTPQPRGLLAIARRQLEAAAAPPQHAQRQACAPVAALAAQDGHVVVAGGSHGRAHLTLYASAQFQPLESHDCGGYGAIATLLVVPWPSQPLPSVAVAPAEAARAPLVVWGQPLRLAGSGVVGGVRDAGPPPWRLLSGHDAGQVLLWEVTGAHMAPVAVLHERSSHAIRSLGLMQGSGMLVAGTATGHLLISTCPDQEALSAARASTPVSGAPGAAPVPLRPRVCKLRAHKGGLVAMSTLRDLVVTCSANGLKTWTERTLRQEAIAEGVGVGPASSLVRGASTASGSFGGGALASTATSSLASALPSAFLASGTLSGSGATSGAALGPEAGLVVGAAVPQASASASVASAGSASHASSVHGRGPIITGAPLSGAGAAAAAAMLSVSCDGRGRGDAGDLQELLRQDAQVMSLQGKLAGGSRSGVGGAASGGLQASHLQELQRQHTPCGMVPTFLGTAAPPPAREADEAERPARGGGGSGRRNKGRNEDHPVDVDIIITAAELKLVTQIGQGAEGTVYMGKWNHIKVACKEFITEKEGAHDLVAASDAGTGGSRDSTSHARKALLAEVRMLKSLTQHPNVVRFCGVCLNPPLVITEYAERGSLFDMLSKARRQLERGITDKLVKYLSWPRRLDMLHDVAAGMDYMHTRNFVHGDLRSPNLFVDKKGEVKIGDFGFATQLTSGARVVDRKKVDRITHPRWLAPEVVSQYQVGKPSDVFSFGIVMWEVLTWRIPYESMGSMAVALATLRKNLRPTIPEDAALPGVACQHLATYKTIMQECWDSNADKRPSFKDLAERLKLLYRQERSARKLAIQSGSGRSTTRTVSASSNANGPPPSSSPGSAAALHSGAGAKMAAAASFAVREADAQAAAEAAAAAAAAAAGAVPAPVLAAVVRHASDDEDGSDEDAGLEDSDDGLDRLGEGTPATALAVPGSGDSGAAGAAPPRPTLPVVRRNAEERAALEPVKLGQLESYLSSMMEANRTLPPGGGGSSRRDSNGSATAAAPATTAPAAAAAAATASSAARSRRLSNGSSSRAGGGTDDGGPFARALLPEATDPEGLPSRQPNVPRVASSSFDVTSSVPDSPFSHGWLAGSDAAAPESGGAPASQGPASSRPSTPSTHPPSGPPSAPSSGLPAGTPQAFVEDLVMVSPFAAGGDNGWMAALAADLGRSGSVSWAPGELSGDAAAPGSGSWGAPPGGALPHLGGGSHVSGSLEVRAPLPTIAESGETWTGPSTHTSAASMRSWLDPASFPALSTTTTCSGGAAAAVPPPPPHPPRAPALDTVPSSGSADSRGDAGGGHADGAAAAAASCGLGGVAGRPVAAPPAAPATRSASGGGSGGGGGAGGWPLPQEAVDSPFAAPRARLHTQAAAQALGGDRGSAADIVGSPFAAPAAHRHSSEQPWRPQSGGGRGSAATDPAPVWESPFAAQTPRGRAAPATPAAALAGADRRGDAHGAAISDSPFAAPTAARFVAESSPAAPRTVDGAAPPLRASPAPAAQRGHAAQSAPFRTRADPATPALSSAFAALDAPRATAGPSGEVGRAGGLPPAPPFAPAEGGGSSGTGSSAPAAGGPRAASGVAAGMEESPLWATGGLDDDDAPLPPLSMWRGASNATAATAATAAAAAGTAAASAARRDAPAAAEESPFAVVGVEESPFAVVGVEESPFAVVGVEESPFAVVGVEASPFAIVGVEESPFAVVGAEESPAAVVGAEESPFAVVGVEESPFAVVAPASAQYVATEDSPFAVAAAPETLPPAAVGAPAPSAAPPQGPASSDEDGDVWRDADSQEQEEEEEEEGAGRPPPPRGVLVAPSVAPSSRAIRNALRASGLEATFGRNLADALGKPVSTREEEPYNWHTSAVSDHERFMADLEPVASDGPAGAAEGGEGVADEATEPPAWPGALSPEAGWDGPAAPGAAPVALAPAGWPPGGGAIIIAHQQQRSAVGRVRVLNMVLPQDAGHAAVLAPVGHPHAPQLLVQYPPVSFVPAAGVTAGAYPSPVMVPAAPSPAAAAAAAAAAEAAVEWVGAIKGGVRPPNTPSPAAWAVAGVEAPAPTSELLAEMRAFPMAGDVLPADGAAPPPPDAWGAAHLSSGS